MPNNPLNLTADPIIDSPICLSTTSGSSDVIPDKHRYISTAPITAADVPGPLTPPSQEQRQTVVGFDRPDWQVQPTRSEPKAKSVHKSPHTDSSPPAEPSRPTWTSKTNLPRQRPLLTPIDAYSGAKRQDPCSTWTVNQFPAAIRLLSHSFSPRRPLNEIQAVISAYNAPDAALPLLNESATSRQVFNYFAADVSELVKDEGKSALWTFLGSEAADATGTVWGTSSAPGVLHWTLIELFKEIESRNKESRPDAPLLSREEFILSVSAAEIAEEKIRDVGAQARLNGICGKLPTQNPRIVNAALAGTEPLSAILFNSLDQGLSLIQRLQEASQHAYQRLGIPPGARSKVGEYESGKRKIGDSARRVMNSVHGSHFVVHITIDRLTTYLSKWASERDDKTRRLRSVVEYAPRRVTRSSLTILCTAPVDCLIVPQARAVSPSQFKLIEFLIAMAEPSSRNEEELRSILAVSSSTQLLDDLLSGNFKPSRLASRTTSSRTLCHVCLHTSPQVIALGFMKFCRAVARAKLLKSKPSTQPESRALRTLFDPLLDTVSLKETTVVLTTAMEAIKSHVIKPEGLDEEVVEAAGRSMLSRMFRADERIRSVDDLAGGLAHSAEPTSAGVHLLAGRRKQTRSVSVLRRAVDAINDAKRLQ